MGGICGTVFIGALIVSTMRSGSRRATLAYVALWMVISMVGFGAIGFFFGMAGELAGELALYVALLCGSLVALVHSRRNPRAKQASAVQS